MSSFWKAPLVAIFPIAAAFASMPPSQQNALVAQYCTVCHTDAIRNGGLSLEHFDAARPDPGVAAMIVSKLKGNALGASGQPLPDRTTQDALQSALTDESIGADRWAFHHDPDALTASIVRETPSTAKEAQGDPDLYRFTLTCLTDTRKGEMQLAWSPGVPPAGQPMAASVDGAAPVTYRIEGKEKMGNGQAGTSGPGAVVLFVPLPAKTLTITNLFPNETVVFPFEGLDRTVRQTLSTCFPNR